MSERVSPEVARHLRHVASHLMQAATHLMQAADVWTEQDQHAFDTTATMIREVLGMSLDEMACEVWAWLDERDLPAPSEGEAATFDECEQAGVDGTLRTVGE